jgi:hypothetical protein
LLRSCALKEFLFAFQRDAFGIVKFPTDGRRLLAYTNSGVDKLKEAYAFSKDGSKIKAEKVTQV